MRRANVFAAVLLCTTPLLRADSAPDAAACAQELCPDTNPYTPEWLAKNHNLYDNKWTAAY